MESFRDTMFLERVRLYLPGQKCSTTHSSCLGVDQRPFEPYGFSRYAMFRADPKFLSFFGHRADVSITLFFLFVAYHVYRAI